jgi:hypothetical protein
LATGPPGLVSILQFHFFLNMPYANCCSYDKKRRRVLWYPTQAKTGLEWGTHHSSPVEETAGPYARDDKV